MFNFRRIQNPRSPQKGAYKFHTEPGSSSCDWLVATLVQGVWLQGRTPRDCKNSSTSVVSPVHYCIGPNGNALLWTPKLPNICKWNSEFPPSDGFLITLFRLSLISRHNASSCICPGCLFCQHLFHWKLSTRCSLYFFTDRFGLQRRFRARLV